MSRALRGLAHTYLTWSHHRPAKTRVGAAALQDWVGWAERAGTLDQRFWSCPGAAGFKLRGASYLRVRRSHPPTPPPHTHTHKVVPSFPGGAVLWPQPALARVRLVSLVVRR